MGHSPPICKSCSLFIAFLLRGRPNDERDYNIDYNIKVALIKNGLQIWRADSHYPRKESQRMKIYEVKNGATHSKRREFSLGFQETGSHACYMIYGVLKPREKARSVKPGP